MPNDRGAATTSAAPGAFNRGPRTTFPDLQYPDRLTPELADRWQRYRQALIDREQGHVDIGIAAARAIEAQLVLLGARPSCSQLADEADRPAREIIDRHALMASR